MSSHGTEGSRREAFKNGSGLQLSRSSRGIHNTKRSVRHLGSSGTSSRGLGSSGSSRNLGGGGGLGADLAKIGRKSSKRNLGSGPPKLSDDISIDDSVLSEHQEKEKPQRRSRSLSQSQAEDKEDKKKQMMQNRKESFRLPPRRNTFNNSVRRAQSSNSRQDPLASRSDHIRSSSARAQSANHGNDLDGSRSEHGTSSATGASNAVKGIKNLIGSMDSSNHNIPKAGDSTQDPSSRAAAFRRTKSMDQHKNSGSTSLRGIYNLVDSSMKDHSGIDRSMNGSLKDRSMNNGSIKDQSINGSCKDRLGNSSREDHDVASAATPESSYNKEGEIGVDHRKSMKGIYKLLGSMRDVKTDVIPTEEEQQQAKEKSHTPRPVRAPRQLQGAGTIGALGRLARSADRKSRDDSSGSESSYGEDAQTNAAAAKRKMADVITAGRKPRMPSVASGSDRVDSRRRVMAAAKLEESITPTVPERSVRSDPGNSTDVVGTSTPDDSADENDVNDFDTVATPKTVAAPQAAIKEAPPPPQRKIVARKNRNTLPQLAKPSSTGSRQSAPAKIPATPSKSPGGFVIHTGEEVAATPVTGKHSLPHSASAMMTPITTPMAMPVVPHNDTDSTVTPRTVPGTPAPKNAGPAPPPPPKRNADPAQRWKERAKSRLPTMPGPTTPTVTRPSTDNARAPTISMLSPGGIVIEVNPATHSHMVRHHNKSNMEPMTPSSMAGELTPGNNSKSPYSHYKALRSTPKSTSNLMMSQGPMTPSMHSTVSELSDGSYPSVPSTPSVQSNSGGISELTPGTFVGRMTPRQTPRGGQIPGTPGTPGFYNSTSGIISELTPGGYSQGLYGDDEEEDEGLRLRTPLGSFHSKTGSEMTPTKFGIILEETSEEDVHETTHPPVPSTPSLHSPAAVVSVVTPVSHSGFPVMDGLSEDGTPKNSVHTPSMSSTGSNMSELTPGTNHFKGVMPSTPSLYSPSGVVSQDSPGNSSSPSFHSGSLSGVVSELTPGNYGAGLLSNDNQDHSNSSSSGQVPILG